MLASWKMRRPPLGFVYRDTVHIVKPVPLKLTCGNVMLLVVAPDRYCMLHWLPVVAFAVSVARTGAVPPNVPCTCAFSRDVHCMACRFTPLTSYQASMPAWYAVGSP